MDLATRCHNHYHRLPDEFAVKLRDEFPSDTVNGLILAARIKGWSLRSIGDALGVTGEAMRLRSLRASPHYAQVRSHEVPDVPVPQPPAPREIPINKRDIPEPEASELRRLNDIARSVNGTARADDPRRTASVELAYRFATLINQGYSPGRIGKAAGVTRSAVMMRVRRHGYVPMWPSQSQSGYHGQAWFEKEHAS